MGKVVVKVPDGPPEHPFLSAAVRAGDFVWVSGHAGLLPNKPPSGSGASWLPGEVVEGGIEAETRQTLESVRQALAAAGATLADVVKVKRESVGSSVGATVSVSML